MSLRPAPIALVAAIAGAAIFAATRPTSSPSEPPSMGSRAQAVEPSPTADTVVEGDDPHAGLPPDHPPIGATAGGSGGGASAPPLAGSGDDAPSIAWKVPDAWKTMPNPNSMRLATYRVPNAAGDTEPVDVTVSRAGGGTEANIQRWVGQFEQAGQPKRTEKTVHGIKVTIVEMSGTFGGGGMGGSSGPRTGWSLLGAVIEAPGTPYFFKMTGPSKTVAATHPAFDTLVASIAPPH